MLLNRYYLTDFIPFILLENVLLENARKKELEKEEDADSEILDLIGSESDVENTVNNVVVKKSKTTINDIENKVVNKTK